MIRKFLKSLSLRGKLLTGFSFIILVFVAFAGYFLNSLNTLDDLFVGLEREYKILNLISGLELNNKKLADYSKAYILTQDPKWEDSYDTALREYEFVLDGIRGLEENRQDLNTVNKFDSLINQLKGTELLILAKVREGNIVKAKEYFDNNYEQKQNDASQLIVGLLETKLKEVSDQFTESRRLADSTRVILIVLILVSLAIMFFVSFLLTSIISRPIQNLFEAVQRIMRGDMKARASVFSGDEIGVLASNFNDMTERLEASYVELEEKVHLRTEELEEKVTELENTREAMVRAVVTLEDIRKKGSPKQ
ncbi:MAG: HAMP domain-containing protein [Candidatus Liptonbacteria bacterium]|nr:HAMP domain-containing protein [Candidatus Liptonbacteria bacterium]